MNKSSGPLKIVLLVSFSLLPLLFINCKKLENKTEDNKTKDVKQNEQFDFRSGLNYDFTKFDRLYTLQSSLKEISGLSYFQQNNSLLAINDEKGKLFELDLNEAKIVSEKKFGKNGDYEGLEAVGKEVFIVKSNGNISQMDWANPTETIIYKTGLSSMHDVEGLSYDANSNKLLLALKGAPFLHQSKEKLFKSILSYDITTSKLDTFLNISDAELLKHYDASGASKDRSKYSVKIEKNRLKSFSPSGISIEPHTGDIYIISARGSTLIRISERKISSVHFLNDDILPQPEGICFDADSNLYISTEGKGFSGRIFKYKPITNSTK